MWLAKAAHAVSDTTPMHFTSLAASTSTVNVNNSLVQVQLQGMTEDDISGFGYVHFYYTSPSGAQVYEGSGGSDGTDAFYGSVEFQQYAEPGVWKPTFTLADASGNTQTLTSSELAQAGMNMDITVVSDNPDLTPPVLEQYGGANASLILYDETQRLQLGALVTDNQPGDIEVMGRFVSPSGNQVINAVSSYVQPENPDEHMLYPEFSPYVEQGEWTTYITIRDRAGNTVNYDPDDLEVQVGNRMNVSITTQQSDVTPVSINNLAFDAANPDGDNVPEAGASISIVSDLTDDLSGLGWCIITYHSQTSTQTSEEVGMAVGSDGKLRLNTQLPPYAAGGVWLPELTTRDLAGNTRVLNHEALLALGYDLSLNLVQSISDTVSSGTTLTTDTANTGATPEAPVQSSVQTPVEGFVSIVTLDLEPTISATNGYLLVGQQVSINAPQATVTAPLTLTFNVEGSTLEPGQTAQNLAVFRNGSLIEPCVDQVNANPDPCVFSRTTLSGGDIEVKVHTSTASAWTLGFPTSQEHQFGGFKKPIKAAPALNKIEAGENIPVKFNFGTGTSTNILAAGSPTSQQISCDTKAPVGDASPALSEDGHGLKLNANGRYRFNFKTLKKWRNTCRQLTFNFTNGETASVYFKLKN